MRAAIISIGDELLIGQVINTNQAFIAEQLNTCGVIVDQMTTVGDSEHAILDALGKASAAYDIITVTGGLGPTHDDITRAVVCRFFHTDLVLNAAALENIRTIFARRNVQPRKVNEDQALVPRDCTVIQNRMGTASGYCFEREGKFFFIMPGVPYEMKAMMEDFVLPFLRQKETGLVIRHKTLKTTGIAESFLAELLGDISSLFPPDAGITLAFLPGPSGVRLRISVQARSIEDAEKKQQEVEQKIRFKAEKYIYSDDTNELEHVVGALLKEHHLTIAIAESCTGGLISDRMTNVPGSSEYFEQGAVAYSNKSKLHDLSVPADMLAAHGAVSRQVAEAMASGIRMKSNSDIGISTTGIAGPTGGSSGKPVGLVWIGYSDAESTFAVQFHFGGDRRAIKERASQAALELLRKKILKIPQE